MDVIIFVDVIFAVIKITKMKKTLKINRKVASIMFNDGKSYSDIAKEFNCTPWAVQKLLKNKKSDQRRMNESLIYNLNYPKLIKVVKYMVRYYNSILAYDLVIDRILYLSDRYNDRILSDSFPERKAADIGIAFMHYKINTIENNN